MLDRDAADRTWVTDDLDAIRIEVHLRGFECPRLITSMINCIHQRFAQSWHGIADPAASLRNTSLLLEVPSRHILEPYETLPQLMMNRAFERALLQQIATGIVRELGDFDARSTKPALRILGKKQ